jgi:hypothetical protein
MRGPNPIAREDAAEATGTQTLEDDLPDKEAHADEAFLHTLAILGLPLPEVAPEGAQPASPQPRKLRALPPSPPQCVGAVAEHLATDGAPQATNPLGQRKRHRQELRKAAAKKAGKAKRRKAAQASKAQAKKPAGFRKPMKGKKKAARRNALAAAAALPEAPAVVPSPPPTVPYSDAGSADGDDHALAAGPSGAADIAGLASLPRRPRDAAAEPAGSLCPAGLAGDLGPGTEPAKADMEKQRQLGQDGGAAAGGGAAPRPQRPEARAGETAAASEGPPRKKRPAHAKPAAAGQPEEGPAGDLTEDPEFIERLQLLEVPREAWPRGPRAGRHSYTVHLGHAVLEVQLPMMNDDGRKTRAGAFYVKRPDPVGGSRNVAWASNGGTREAWERAKSIAGLALLNP